MHTFDWSLGTTKQKVRNPIYSNNIQPSFLDDMMGLDCKVCPFACSLLWKKIKYIYKEKKVFLFLKKTLFFLNSTTSKPHINKNIQKEVLERRNK